MQFPHCVRNYKRGKTLNDHINDVLSVTISAIIFATAVTTIFFALQSLRGFNDFTVGIVNEKQSISTTGGNSLANSNASASRDELTAHQVLNMILSSSDDVNIYINGSKLDKETVERAKAGVASSVKEIKDMLSGKYRMETIFDTDGTEDYVKKVKFTSI